MRSSLRPFVRTLRQGIGAATISTQQIADTVRLFPPRVLFDPRLSIHDRRIYATPWFHDWSPLGLRTPQTPEFVENQKCKTEPITRLIRRALELCPSSRRGVELFCADGYFAQIALNEGADYLLGVDLNEVYLAQANLMARLRGTRETVAFKKLDVFDLTGEFDFAICAGGLYHLEEPAKLMRQLRDQVNHALVIQTVYSKSTNDVDYFEAPAPGWTWGCRFSYHYLVTMVEEAGWRILHAETNELLGNERPEDRGSAYLLCVPNT